METSIQTFIDMCQWDTTKFLIFSNNVFGMLIYYSHLSALVLSLAIGIFIFFRDKKSLINKLLFFITLTFSLWVFLDLFLWANEKPDLQMFAWSMIILVELLIYILSLYFIDVFINKQDISLKKKFGIFLPLLPVIILLPTKFLLQGFDLTNCYRDTSEGFLAIYYVYLIEIFYAFWILLFLFKEYKKALPDIKKQIILISTGIILFLISFVSGNIIGSLTDSWTTAQIGLFGMPIFVGFLAYMIVKFKTFNIKMIGAQALVFALGFSVLGIIFIRTVENVRLVAIATLLLIIIVGYLLIKGVKREVAQKEQLAALNESLKNLIKQRESLVHLITHKVKGSFTRTKFLFAGMLDGTFGEISPEIRKRAEQGLEFDNGGIQTVDLVLNAANLENGIIKYDMKKVNFKDVVSETINDKKLAAEAKSLQIETKMEDGFYNVEGDAFWLKEVVNNLIDNSIKYTREGKILVELKDGDGKVRLSITDTGIGITEEDKTNLFKEGGRGKDSVKINVDSTGYGLYTVKLVVEAHKGRVWAESEGSNKGSKFFVELPAIK